MFKPRNTPSEAKIDTKTTKQVLIDAGLHQLLKKRAKAAKQSIKGLLEEVLAEVLAVKGDQNGNNQ
ncbi:MAG: hypothetical protein HYV90_03780 [Candidatus Woesebacteria bacterium]|nr:MAG: hypothetical protein HYV90_03780 [Candidatus Woesebacteria bacterium]